MINTRLSDGCSISITPSISFPFLWQSVATGRIYLRLATCDKPTHVDVLLVKALHGDNSLEIGALMATGMSDREAWKASLAPNRSVTLTNT